MEAIMIDRLMVWFLAAYLFGSLPWGYLLVRWRKGADIRRFGSGNIGFTNVRRTYGWKLGLLVLLADIAKGFLPALVAMLYFQNRSLSFAFGMAAALGHARSVFFFLKEGKFQGGKAVATSFGGMCAAFPWAALPTSIVWFLILKKYKIMSIASLTACWFALIPISIIYHNWIYIVEFVALALFVTYLHRRNIGQALDGTERKFFDDEEPQNLAISAFVIHPVNITDLKQSKQIGLVLLLQKIFKFSDEALANYAIKFPTVKVDEIKGICDNQGNAACMFIFGIPMLPEKIRDPENKSAVLEKLKKATLLADRMGVKTIGFGGLLSTVGNGGSEVQRWAIEHKLEITVTNGGTFTASATIDACEQKLKEKKIALLSLRPPAVIGAGGVIGRPIANHYLKVFGKVLVNDKFSERLEEFDATSIQSSEDLAWLQKSQLVIFATSHPGFILTKDQTSCLAPNTILADVAVPPDVDPAILSVRADVTLIRCGVIEFPGEPSCRIDFHFGKNPSGKQYFPACMAETVILSLVDQNIRKEKTTLGARIRHENLLWYLTQASLRGFKIIPSEIFELEAFAGNGGK